MVRGHCNTFPSSQDGKNISVHKWMDRERVPYNEILFSLQKE